MTLQELIIAINCASLRYHRFYQSYKTVKKKTDQTLHSYYRMIEQYAPIIAAHHHYVLPPKDKMPSYQYISKSLYRALCKTYHPDISNDTANIMPRINQAYAEAKQGQYGELFACCHELISQHDAPYMSIDDIKHYYHMIQNLADTTEDKYQTFLQSDAHQLAQRIEQTDKMNETAFKVAQHMTYAA